LLKLRIPKNRIQYLLRHLAKSGDVGEAERGWAIYHRGHVLNLRMSKSAATVYAAVRDGNGMRDVALDLADFAASECTCGAPLPCVHMMAITFALYAPYGRPELLLPELRALIAKGIQLQAAKSKRPSSGPKRPETPEPNGPVQAWQDDFERRFSGFSLTHSYTFDMFAQAVWETLPDYAASWPQQRKLLFLMNVALFALRRIETFYEQSTMTYLSAHHEENCRTAIAACSERLLEATTTYVSGLRPADAALWRDTLRLLSEYALRGKASPVPWLDIYREVWWLLADDKELSQAEVQRLDGILSHTSGSASEAKRNAALIAKVHHLAMANGDLNKSLKLLNELSKRQPSDFAFYLKRHAQRGEWASLLAWLRWLQPSMKTAVAGDFRMLCQYWTEAAKHTDADREWVIVMEGLLPRSYPVYTAYLLQTKRYREWIDLQLATRVSPLQLYALELRAVEKDNPSLLLPLYHQAAERAVLEKNRASYKIAMRLLEKLAELYRTLDRTKDWEHFVQRFGAKFSRLRAFQAEFKKGRWLS